MARVVSHSRQQRLVSNLCGQARLSLSRSWSPPRAFRKCNT
nr:MAG TPA: hypothetical protein [Caudoviricetes sp.]